MDTGTYNFKSLESKYKKFIAPSFVIEINGKDIDSAKVPVTSLSVVIEGGNAAGGCSFTISAMYDYEKGVWGEGLLNTIDVGQELKVFAGYSTAASSGTSAKKGDMVKVFSGFVNDFTIEYSSDAAPQLSVNAIDGLAFLMSEDKRKDWGAKSVSEIVTEIVGGIKEKGYIDSFDVSGVPSFQAQLSKKEGYDNFEFLCEIANMCFLNMTVIAGELLFKNLMSSSSSIITLNMGVNLFSFSKRLSLGSETVGKVKVTSTIMPDGTVVSGEATKPSIAGPGKPAAGRASAFGEEEKLVQLNFLRTAEECKTMAQAIFDKMALDFVSGSGRCIGIPELIPGRYITLKGMDERSDGSYFITRVTHTYSDAGYFTDFEVKGAASN